jgi:DNA-binding transcriptional regulator YdaS (Cro superfamily)
MDLREFIQSHPRHQRAQVRRRIAVAHGIAEVTVRSWANGQRNHPCSLAAVRITEKVTNGLVTRYDLRPDVFQKE